MIRRYEGNPILRKTDVPYPAETVHNAVVVKHRGRYTMIFRSHPRNGRSILSRAESDDGFRCRVRLRPSLTPATQEPFAAHEEYDVEDPRIRPPEGAALRHGVPVAPTRSEDFERVERIALIT